MNRPDWVRRFLDDGPGYDAERRSVAEMQALLLKAGIGAGLPLGHAQDFAGLAPLLMSDPQLMGMAVAALETEHRPVRTEGTVTHVVIEGARIAMAGPVVVDAFVCGAERVVLHDLDWPMLLWPVLAQAQSVFGLGFTIARPDAGTVLVTRSAKSDLDLFGAPQAVPVLLLDRLAAMAARTYVPSSAASRSTGAGAGLQDND